MLLMRPPSKNKSVRKFARLCCTYNIFWKTGPRQWTCIRNKGSDCGRPIPLYEYNNSTQARAIVNDCIANVVCNNPEYIKVLRLVEFHVSAQQIRCWWLCVCTTIKCILMVSNVSQIFAHNNCYTSTAGWESSVAPL